MNYLMVQHTKCKTAPSLFFACFLALLVASHTADTWLESFFTVSHALVASSLVEIAQERSCTTRGISLANETIVATQC